MRGGKDGRNQLIEISHFFRGVGYRSNTVGEKLRGGFKSYTACGGGKRQGTRLHLMSPLDPIFLFDGEKTGERSGKLSKKKGGRE